MEFKIIQGKKQDLPLLLKMIKELAKFERSPDSVTNKVKWMEKDGFGEGKIFDFYFVLCDGKKAGMAITYFRYSTWKGKTLFLEDIYIRPEFRGKGIGKFFLKFLSRRCLEQGSSRMAWQVLDWNADAIEFYKGLGASMDSEWINCAFEEKELKELALNA
jgi:GNAT superfamily N-acetyltransferase